MSVYFRKIEIALLVAALLAILAVGVSVVHSFDVFWQLQSGRYMVETGAILDKDVFTLSPDDPRYEHCWLHDIALYLIYLVGGYKAISIWKGVTVLATTVLLIVAARFRNSSLTAILAALPLVFLTAGGWLERPQLWTFLCFAWFVFCLERYRKTKSRIIYLLFPVMVFWANAHSGAVLGLLVFLAYFAGDLANRLLQERRLGLTGGSRFLIGAAVAVLGASLTPKATHWLNILRKAQVYGGGSVVKKSDEVVQHVTQTFNMDWTTTTFAMEPFFFYALGVAAVLAILTIKKIDFVDLFLLGGLAIMGLGLVRHIPFFYFGCLAILPRYLDHIADFLKRFIKAPWTHVVQVVLLVGIVFWFWWLYQPQYRIYGPFSTGLREWHYPIEATEFVKEHELPANIYNTYDWGGYMAWKLFPDYQVFWDGRQISTKMFQLGWTVMAGKPEWEQILNKFDVKTIVSRSSTIDTGQMYPFLDKIRAHKDWYLVFNDESSMVFVKRGSVPDAWLAKYAKPKIKMDDTILSEAHLMVSVNPKRYMAWWEMGKIYLKRKQYRNAHAAFRQHLMRSPRPQPQAQKIYKDLTEFLKKQQAQAKSK